MLNKILTRLCLISTAFISILSYFLGRKNKEIQIIKNNEKLLLELKNKYSSVLQKRKEARNNIKELENISTNFNQE